MRKYLQITFVLGAFGLLVLLRQLKGNDMPIVGVQNANNQTSIPTPGLGVSSTSQASPTTGNFKDGTYTGSVQDAFYGNIQVQAVITGGKLTDVIFLQYPNDNRTSQYVNSQADPILRQEAIQAQSANVNIVSGASASSQAFQQSLADALAQAK